MKTESTARQPLFVLLTGASGLIGQSLLSALLANGHRVRALCRRPPANDGQSGVGVEWVAADITRLPATDWQALLDGIDVAINTVGIFQEAATATPSQSPAQSFEALHVRAPTALFEACVAAGVPQVVQLSALGAALDAPTAYGRSKAQADAALHSLPLHGTVVRPSLVYADNGTSSQFFRQMAAGPVLVVPSDAGQVQPLHVDDLTALVLDLLTRHAQGVTVPRILNAVGPRALAWVDYVQVLRLGMGWDAARVWRVPPKAMDGLVRLAAPFSSGMLSADSLRLLRAGNVADAAPAQALLGRPLRDPASFTHPALATQALWAWSRPALVGSVAFVWLWTAWVSLMHPQAGWALMGAMGLPAAAQTPALWLGAGLDATFGLLTLLRPSRRLWWAQWTLVASYTVLITAGLPEWWLHPFGPVSKNLPFLAVLVCLALHEKKR